MNEHSSQQQEERSSSRNEWTPSRVAAVILFAIFCAVLVWNAYSPEDIYYGDLKFEVDKSEEYEPRVDQSLFEKTIQIGETYYPKGISTFGNSEISLRFVPETHSYFTAEIGIDAEMGEDSPASVVFTVMSDGTVLYQSPVMRAGMAPRLVYVPIRGRRTVILKTSDAGDGNEDDYAHWAVARFVK